MGLVAGVVAIDEGFRMSSIRVMALREARGWPPIVY